MSSDAKAWQDSEGWLSWKGCHDGPCRLSKERHEQGGTLQQVINNIELCMGGRELRWFFRKYPDGKVGLVGYTT